MNRDEALAALTPVYAAALRLRESGCVDAQIAAQLDIDEASVGALLYLAQAKLDRVLATPSDDVHHRSDASK